MVVRNTELVDGVEDGISEILSIIRCKLEPLRHRNFYIVLAYKNVGSDKILRIIDLSCVRSENRKSMAAFHSEGRDKIEKLSRQELYQKLIQ